LSSGGDVKSNRAPVKETGMAALLLGLYRACSSSSILPKSVKTGISPYNQGLRLFRASPSPSSDFSLSRGSLCAKMASGDHLWKKVTHHLPFNSISVRCSLDGFLASPLPKPRMLHVFKREDFDRLLNYSTITHLPYIVITQIANAPTMPI